MNVGRDTNCIAWCKTVRSGTKLLLCKFQVFHFTFLSHHVTCKVRVSFGRCGNVHECPFFFSTLSSVVNYDKPILYSESGVGAHGMANQSVSQSVGHWLTSALGQPVQTGILVDPSKTAAGSLIQFSTVALCCCIPSQVCVCVCASGYVCVCVCA